MPMSKAVDRAEELITAAVRRQLESDVPLGALLSGGIDSSLVSAAAQQALGGTLQTFNVKFTERQFDETWAAIEVANAIGSAHSSLEMSDTRGSWSTVTGVLLHA